MKSSVVKHSIVLAGHHTSVSLEDAFWKSLKEIAGRRDEPAEMRVEFGRPAGDVERRDRLVAEHREHEIDDLGRHLLGTLRACADMTMHAGLIAAIAEIDLQGLEPAAPERRKSDLFEQRQRVAHRSSRIPCP